MNLKQTLQDGLSYSNFTNLHILMKTSKNRVTRILSNPEQMSKKEIIALAAIIDKPTNWLIENYGVGKHIITYAEIEELKELDENNLQNKLDKIKQETYKTPVLEDLEK